MTQDTTALFQAEANGKPPKPRGSRPVKILPTDRIAFKKQLELLRAYAIATGPNNKAATNEEVAVIAKMNASTASIANAFFVSAGLLQEGAGGRIPSQAVMNFNLAYDWNPETAGHKLASVLQEAWFGKTLLPRLSLHPMEETEAVATLAQEASAGPDYERQIRVILEYLEVAGLVQRDGSLLRIGRVDTASIPQTPLQEPETRAESRDTQTSKPAVATTFAQMTEGIVQFHISVRVEMNQFANWRPDRIAAFFSGIAQVLAAKADVEKGGSEA